MKKTTLLIFLVITNFVFSQNILTDSINIEKIDNTILNYKPTVNIKTKNTFSTELICYKEPYSNPLGYGKYYDYTIK